MTSNLKSSNIHVLSKLNTFHWHVTDSQSFPIQIPGFVELSTAGAYSNASVYTLSDVQDIVEYAGQVGLHFSFCLLAMQIADCFQRGIDVLVVRSLF